MNIFISNENSSDIFSINYINSYKNRLSRYRDTICRLKWKNNEDNKLYLFTILKNDIRDLIDLHFLEIADSYNCLCAEACNNEYYLKKFVHLLNTNEDVRERYYNKYKNYVGVDIMRYMKNIQIAKHVHNSLAWIKSSFWYCENTGNNLPYTKLLNFLDKKYRTDVDTGVNIGQVLRYRLFVGNNRPAGFNRCLSEIDIRFCKHLIRNGCPLGTYPYLFLKTGYETVTVEHLHMYHHIVNKYSKRSKKRI